MRHDGAVTSSDRAGERPDLGALADGVRAVTVALIGTPRAGVLDVGTDISSAVTVVVQRRAAAVVLVVLGELNDNTTPQTRDRVPTCWRSSRRWW